MIIKHGRHNFGEIHEVCKGLWDCFLDCADWLGRWTPVTWVLLHEKVCAIPCLDLVSWWPLFSSYMGRFIWDCSTVFCKQSWRHQMQSWLSCYHSLLIFQGGGSLSRILYIEWVCIPALSQKSPFFQVFQSPSPHNCNPSAAIYTVEIVLFCSKVLSNVEHTVFQEWFEYLMTHQKPQVDVIGEISSFEPKL